MSQSVATHLMFMGSATAALELYASVFPAFRVHALARYPDNAPAAAGLIQRADILFGEHRLVVIDSPVAHAFTFTPAISLFVDCKDAAELDSAFGKLAEGGQVLMPVADYGFSRRFGWCADRFGVSWQLNLP